MLFGALGASWRQDGRLWRQLWAALGATMLAFDASWRQEGRFWSQDEALLEWLGAKMAFFWPTLLQVAAR